MKAISIMELRKNVYAATKELPIMVTAKGETLFYIVKELTTVQNKPIVTGYVQTNVLPQQNILNAMEGKKIDTSLSGWCQLHFEKGVTYELKLITWEDENGAPVIEKKLACPKCISKYENMGRGKVYFL